MVNTIVIRKKHDKINVENTFGLQLATVSKNDTEFYEPVTEAELVQITQVVSNFSLFLENIIEE